MGRASDLFYNSMAIDDRAEAKTITPTSTSYTDNFADIIVTPLYFYQSVPVTTNLGTLVKYLQFIRSEVLDNAHLVTRGGALDNDSYLWTWGDNAKGQLGNNSTTFSSVPVSVIGNRKFNQVVSNHHEGASFFDAVAALDNDGQAWTWGYNTNGNLGDNTVTDRSSPVSVVGAYQFVTISANSSNFSALDMSGFAWTWGSDNSGSLGDNNSGSHSSPVSVVGGINFVAIDGAVAIDTNNNCWAWGLNTNGQLGNSSTTTTSSPVAMVGAPGSNGNTVAVASYNQGGDSSHTLTLDSDGYCNAVGQNNLGQLGDNTTTDRSSPISVIGGKKFTQIAAGNGISFGLDNAGILWTWGNTKDGVSRSSPVSVRQGTRKFAQMQYRDSTIVATDMDGNIWVWGVIPWISGGGTASSNPLLLPGGLYGQVKKY